MNNELTTARLAHWVLILACVALISLSLISETAGRYLTARVWLTELHNIDLDNWAKNLENRQTVVLIGSLRVSPVIKEEAKDAQVRVDQRLNLREQVAISARPSVSDVGNATMETLLTSVFRDVEEPDFFYIDKQELQTKLRALFTGQSAERFSHLILSNVVLDVDPTREVSARAWLRLKWFTDDATTRRATQPTFSYDLPLAGEHKDAAFDFDEFILHMHPRLAGLNPPWTEAVREQLSPVWDEIKEMPLADALVHVETRLNETRGNVSLFGVTIQRSLLLVFGPSTLLILICVVMTSLRRLVTSAPLDFPGSPLFPGQLAPALTLLSVVILPIATFWCVFVRLGEVRLSPGTIAFVLAAVAGTICALLSYRRILGLRRPLLSDADRERIALAKGQVALYRRSVLRPSRIVGYLLLAIGLVSGPVGAFAFSFYLIGLGIGSQAAGGLPLLAVLLSPVLVLVGWVLAAGHKELVLFLRRFGNETLNDSVRDLVHRVLRKRARLVTLDDSAFVPMGPRWRGFAVSLIPSGIVLSTIALGYEGFARVAQSELEDETPFGTALALIQVGIVFVGFVASLVAILLFVAALRAHFVGRMSVHDDRSRTRAMKRLRKFRSLMRAPVITAPMATVVSVTDPEWQATVASIARLCDVTLIDISQPRENIRWELATLVEARVRVVLLAQREALARWWETTGDEADARLAEQMRSLATGLPLVIYDAPDRLNESELLKLLSEPADLDPQ